MNAKYEELQYYLSTLADLPPVIDTTIIESFRFYHLLIFCFFSPLKIQMVSGNSTRNVDGTCYNPAAN